MDNHARIYMIDTSFILEGENITLFRNEPTIYNTETRLSLYQ